MDFCLSSLLSIYDFMIRFRSVGHETQTPLVSFKHFQHLLQNNALQKLPQMLAIDCKQDVFLCPHKKSYFSSKFIPAVVAKMSTPCLKSSEKSQTFCPQASATEQNYRWRQLQSEDFWIGRSHCDGLFHVVTTSQLLLVELQEKEIFSVGEL